MCVDGFSHITLKFSFSPNLICMEHIFNSSVIFYSWEHFMILSGVDDDRWCEICLHYSKTHMKRKSERKVSFFSPTEGIKILNSSEEECKRHNVFILIIISIYISCVYSVDNWKYFAAHSTTSQHSLLASYCCKMMVAISDEESSQFKLKMRRRRIF